MKALSRVWSISYSSIAICLCMVSLLLFRGPLSLMSAVVIPLIIAILSYKLHMRYNFLAAAGLSIITGLFFTTQLIFVMTYLLMGLLIKLLLYSKRSNVISFWIVRFVLYVVSTGTLLYLGIRLTEALFYIPLHEMMLRMSNGNMGIYGLIILAEALFVSSIHFVIMHNIRKRLLFQTY